MSIGMGATDAPEGWQSAIDAGADGIQTDRPGPLVEFLRSKGYKKMTGAKAMLRLELYYQGSVPAATTKPVVSEVAVTEEGNLYLEEKDHPNPNLPQYSFRVAKIAAGAVTLEQIPDRRGQTQRFGSPDAGGTLRLERDKPLRISLNVPGGGPVWTVTLIH